jgi:ribosomal protein S17E
MEMELKSEIDGGEFVACDFCNGGEETMGGALVGSNAVCGKCLKNVEEKYPEEITERFDVNKTFRQNVLEYRVKAYGTSHAITRIYVPETKAKYNPAEYSNEMLLEEFENYLIDINVGTPNYQEACDNIKALKQEISMRMEGHTPG